MDRLPEIIAAYPWRFTSPEFSDLQSELPAGRYGLMLELCRKMSEELAAEERSSALHIKEKLGRVYIRDRGPERVFRLVDATCDASREHCATCGLPIAEPTSETALPVCPRHTAQGRP